LHLAKAKQWRTKSARSNVVAKSADEIATRLVVLGDPGGGKTTLLRWMATAYLLRLSNDRQLNLLPDNGTLPQIELGPVLIRCRELDSAQLRTVVLDELLQRAVHRLDIPATRDVQNELAGLLKELLIEGKALLLVDGLDEIPDPISRAQFAE